MSASVKLICVPPKLKRLMWPYVADRLRSAYLKTDLAHTADLERDTLQGDADLWIVTDGDEISAAGVTLLVRTDKHLICNILALGGAKTAQWFDLLPALEDWARGQGAKKVRIFGREGWTRILKNYRVSNVVLERFL